MTATAVLRQNALRHLSLGVCVTLLLCAFWLATTTRPVAAGFAVGYVDSELAIKGHPKFASTQQAVATYRENRLKELNSFKGRTLSDAEKKELLIRNETINAEVDKHHDQLFAPLASQVAQAIDAVGAQSGVEVVLEAAAVHFGGVDLTPAVIKELQKHK
ncbi:MAG: hypothetical protein GEEBNDBF_02327 [bacterium]|nr:hypothetical protein [bacterium]